MVVENDEQTLVVPALELMDDDEVEHFVIRYHELDEID